MAKKFKFNLDSVLKYRKNIEEKKLLEFSKIQAKVFERKRQIEKMDLVKQEQQDMISKLYHDKADIRSIVDVYRYVNNLDTQKFNGQKELSVTEFEMEQRRGIYLEARKQRKALDLLKDKRKDEYIKNENVEEARVLDDLSIQQIISRNNNKEE